MSDRFLQRRWFLRFRVGLVIVSRSLYLTIKRWLQAVFFGTHRWTAGSADAEQFLEQVREVEAKYLEEESTD
jgi:hypothetical protein